MRKDLVLVTNNSYFQKLVDLPRLQFIRGTSLDVLINVRDAVHLGSDLLTHPLYGNLRPDQQPFRSVLLRNPAQKERNFSSVAYLDSISMIEEALLLYRGYGSRLKTPDYLPEATREDYAFVDSELMRESLTLYGMLTKGSMPNFEENSSEGGERVCQLI